MYVTLLELTALILFALAAIGIPSSRINLVAAGLAALTLALVMGGLKL